MDNSAAMLDQKLKRLNVALEFAGVARGSRNKVVAEATGYTEGSVRGILSGNASLSDRFVKAVCSKFGIRYMWVSGAEEPMLTVPGELPYCGDSYNRYISKSTTINLKAALSSQPNLAKINILKAALIPPSVTPLNKIVSQPVSEKQLKRDISKHFEYYDEEQTDDLDIGSIISEIVFHLPHLARHEVLELLHQVWKLRYNRSDSLAVQVADEDFERYGIKPTTRLKLERIPVEGSEGEEQE